MNLSLRFLIAEFLIRKKECNANEFTRQTYKLCSKFANGSIVDGCWCHGESCKDGENPQKSHLGRRRVIGVPTKLQYVLLVLLDWSIFPSFVSYRTIIHSFVAFNALRWNRGMLPQAFFISFAMSMEQLYYDHWVYLRTNAKTAN